MKERERERERGRREIGGGNNDYMRGRRLR